MRVRFLTTLGFLVIASCASSSTIDTRLDAAVDAGSRDLDTRSPDLDHVDLGCTDADGDGHRAISCGGDDCNDADPRAFPGNVETCDVAGHDDDCNPATLGPDADHDGFVASNCCNNQPSGAVVCGVDCDDTRAAISPGVVESCNAIDDNCNGLVDEGGCFCGSDSDCGDGVYCNGDERCMPGSPLGDARGCMPGPLPCGGVGSCSESTRTCGCGDADVDGDGHRSVACGGDDCNDTDPGAYPGNTERCDPIGHDDDCDPSTLGPDLDGDGFVSRLCCNVSPSGALLCGTDCDDTRPTVSPVAPELCNGVDDNCNGVLDEGGCP